MFKKWFLFLAFAPTDCFPLFCSSCCLWCSPTTFRTRFSGVDYSSNNIKWFKNQLKWIMRSQYDKWTPGSSSLPHNSFRRNYLSEMEGWSWRTCKTKHKERLWGAEVCLEPVRVPGSGKGGQQPGWWKDREGWGCRKGLEGRPRPHPMLSQDNHSLRLPFGDGSQAGHVSAHQETKSPSGKQSEMQLKITRPPPRAAAHCECKDTSLSRGSIPWEEVGLTKWDQEWLCGAWGSVTWGLSPPLSLNPVRKT